MSKNVYTSPVLASVLQAASHRRTPCTCCDLPYLRVIKPFRRTRFISIRAATTKTKLAKREACSSGLPPSSPLNRGASLDRRRKAVAARSWPRRRGCGAARIRLMRRAGGRVDRRGLTFFKAAINERDRLIGRGFLLPCGAWAVLCNTLGLFVAGRGVARVAGCERCVSLAHATQASDGRDGAGKRQNASRIQSSNGRRVWCGPIHHAAIAPPPKLK